MRGASSSPGVIVLVLIGVLAVSGCREGRRPYWPVQQEWSVTGWEEGSERDQISLIVLVANGCAGSQQPMLERNVTILRELLAKDAERLQVPLISMGVALDRSIQSGLGILARLGPFDEILVGGGWYGEGAARYVWRDLAGEAILPQVLLVRRTVQSDGHAVSIGIDRLIARAVGNREIARFVEAGVNRGIAVE